MLKRGGLERLESEMENEEENRFRKCLLDFKKKKRRKKLISHLNKYAQ